MVETNEINYNEDVIKSNILDYMWRAIDGVVKQENWFKSFGDLKEEHSACKQFVSLVADIISILDIEMSVAENHSRKERFYSLVQTIKAEIGDDLLKERLEIETLENLKLITKKEVFNQKYIKIKTRLFYKQQKFNLIREESEGYSKLITELNSTTHQHTELNVDILLQNIQSLIGCFNLDPNRVLDIILESFENTPSLYNVYIALIKLYNPDRDTLTNLIGFKYQQQAQNAQSLNDEHTSNNLYFITSYLLKHSIINIDQLKVHLSPSDDEIMQLYREELNQSKQYAKKLTVNTLIIQTSTTPTTLSDTKDKKQQQSSSNIASHIPSSLDDISTNGSNANNNNNNSSQTSSNYNSSLIITSTSNSSSLDTSHLYTSLVLTSSKINQKVLLVKYLLKIGDLKNALILLEKLPTWFISIYSSISQSICKYIRQMMRPFYLKYNPLHVLLLTKQDAQTSDGVIRTLRQFTELLLPILKLIGPAISYDSILFTQLIRVCIEFMNRRQVNGGNVIVGDGDVVRDNDDDDDESSNLFYESIYSIVNDIFLPSLSMLQYINPCVAQELWQLINKFSYEMRYSLYTYWKTKTYLIHPVLIRVKAECTEKIKYLLKRLSKENVKIYGRQIGKLSHLNPIIINDYILQQIQRYDNFIHPIVDSLKYCTSLTYDVLSYSIINELSSDPDKDKMKYDSISISSWLQSISLFSGLVFKKYPIELISIIQYVINQLIQRKSYDLLILQEIVQKMCGIEITSEATDMQLDSMCGGDLLRQEAGFYNQIRNTKKSSSRLKEALVDFNLVLPLSILLSQERDYIIFNKQEDSEQKHMKLIGHLYDQCQDSLVQFSTFLSSTLTTDEYIRIFPKIDDLVNTYHVSLDVAFFLSRPMYIHHIQSKYDELRKHDRSAKSLDKPSKLTRYLEAIDFVMKPINDLVKTLHSNKLWLDMSPQFYTTFWTLSCNDLYVPSLSYDKLRLSLKQKILSLDDNQELTSSKKKKEKEKLNALIDKLSEEEQKQRDHVGFIKARLEREKEMWFPNNSSLATNLTNQQKSKGETINEFLQLCIFSRCLFTQIDAIYCAKFIQIIHSLKTPNFSTIICYDRIFSDITYSIASLTDTEARRYGRFLLGLLETVMYWHSSQDVFDKECHNYPGFLTVFRNAIGTSQSSTKQEQLDYENFRHVSHKWHYKLTKSFIVCLESDEYIQIRNSLIILTKILPHYPKINGFYSALEKRVDKIKSNEKEKRPDLYTLASVYLGQLRQRRTHMIDESKFHLKETPKVTEIQVTSKLTPLTTKTTNGTLGKQDTAKVNTSDEKKVSSSTTSATLPLQQASLNDNSIKSPKRQRTRSRSVSPSVNKSSTSSSSKDTTDRSNKRIKTDNDTSSISNGSGNANKNDTKTSSNGNSNSSNGKSSSRDHEHISKKDNRKREHSNEVSSEIVTVTATTTATTTTTSTAVTSQATQSASSTTGSQREQTSLSSSSSQNTKRTKSDEKDKQQQSSSRSKGSSPSSKRSSKKNDNNQQESTKSSSSHKDKRNSNYNDENSNDRNKSSSYR